MTNDQIRPRLRRYLEQEGNSVGGSLHIYTADGNLENGHIVFCREWALQHGDQEGAEIAGMILRLTYRQRRRLIAGL